MCKETAAETPEGAEFKQHQDSALQGYLQKLVCRYGEAGLRVAYSAVEQSNASNGGTSFMSASACEQLVQELAKIAEQKPEQQRLKDRQPQEMQPKASQSTQVKHQLGGIMQRTDSMAKSQLQMQQTIKAEE